MSVCPYVCLPACMPVFTLSLVERLDGFANFFKGDRGSSTECQKTKNYFDPCNMHRVTGRVIQHIIQRSTLHNRKGNSAYYPEV